MVGHSLSAAPHRTDLTWLIVERDQKVGAGSYFAIVANLSVLGTVQISRFCKHPATVTVRVRQASLILPSAQTTLSSYSLYLIDRCVAPARFMASRVRPLHRALFLIAGPIMPQQIIPVRLSAARVL
jgi:hypothetical protein